MLRRAPVAARARLIGLALAGLFWPAIAAAQTAPGDNPLLAAIGSPSDLTLRASFRVRREAIFGQFRPAVAEHDALWSFRSDIFAEYRPGAFRIGGELRDGRGYGESGRSSAGVAEINALEPLQAFVGLDLKDFDGHGHTALLTAGRYTLELGSGRLVGRPDFSDSINSYTGVTLDLGDRHGDRLFLFWSLPSTRLPNAVDALHANHIELDRARLGYRFYGAHATRARGPDRATFEGYVFGLAEDDAPYLATRDRHLLTIGARMFRRSRAGHADYDVEAVRQSGHEHATTAPTDTVMLPVRAYFVHAEAGLRLAARWTPRFSLHADLATGDDRDPSRITRFDTLFGATRPDFGPTALYGPLTRSNLLSLGARFEVSPGPRLDAFVMARALRLDVPTDTFAATGVRDPSGRSGKDAGLQLEARLRYWIVPKLLHTDVGGALLAKGRFLADAPNAPATGDTRYLFVDLQVDL